MTDKQRAYLVLGTGLALVVLGQRLVKRQAEALGLSRMQKTALNAGASATGSLVEKAFA